MQHLIGSYECKADSKGRIMLPVALKKQLYKKLKQGFVIKRAVFNKCLELYPISEWELLMKRINKLNQNIYIVPKSKIKHLGGKAVDIKFEHEIEMSRNWHWIWSKFYFNKKHFGFFAALKEVLPSFFSALIKLSIFFFLKKRKRDIYLQRILGFINALIGRSSHYRPKINN